jgi:hypothetical protein
MGKASAIANAKIINPYRCRRLCLTYVRDSVIEMGPCLRMVW